MGLSIRELSPLGDGKPRESALQHKAKLVAFEKTHAPVLQEWLSEPTTLATATLEIAAPLSLQKATEMIEHYESSSTSYMFGVLCVKCGELVGFASIGFIDWKNRSGYVGLVIGNTKHRRLGMGKQGLTMLVEFAFGELALNRVYGDVLATNEISIRMLRSLGFVHEGTKREACFRSGTFLDVHIYALLAREWKESQANDINERS